MSQIVGDVLVFAFFVFLVEANVCLSHQEIAMTGCCCCFVVYFCILICEQFGSVIFFLKVYFVNVPDLISSDIVIEKCYTREVPVPEINVIFKMVAAFELCRPMTS